MNPKLKQKVSHLKTKITRMLDPTLWTLKSYLGVMVALLSLNAFGPQGLVQFILLHQEKTRLSAQLLEKKKQIDHLDIEIKNFKGSELYRMKTIRQELGLLKSDEISFELLTRTPDSR